MCIYTYQFHVVTQYEYHRNTIHRSVDAAPPLGRLEHLGPARLFEDGDLFPRCHLWRSIEKTATQSDWVDFRETCCLCICMYVYIYIHMY